MLCLLNVGLYSACVTHALQFVNVTYSLSHFGEYKKSLTFESLFLFLQQTTTIFFALL